MNTTSSFHHEIAKLQNLELLARQVVEGFLIGLHKSPFHGFSVEFAEHRLYNPGESTRHIDWKVFARTDRLYVKRFEEETNLRCMLVMDASSSMFFPEQEESKSGMRKIDFAALAAASIMQLLRKQRDAFGLTVFSGLTESMSEVKSSSVHHKFLLGKLEQLLARKERNRKTAAARALHEIADKIHRRSLVIIFSDMLENVDAAETEAIFSALQHLRHNKHEVILFHVTDKLKEMDFEFANRPYRFVDLETGDEVKVQPSQVKKFYVEQMQMFFHRLKLRCAQFKIDLVEADINQGFTQVLLPYLMKREKFS